MNQFFCTCSNKFKNTNIWNIIALDITTVKLIAGLNILAKWFPFWGQVRARDIIRSISPDKKMVFHIRFPQNVILAAIRLTCLRSIKFQVRHNFLTFNSINTGQTFRVRFECNLSRWTSLKYYLLHLMQTTRFANTNF